jgi:hypothetical protein
MYAASYGERDVETAAVSCPVFGHDLRIIGALSVSGPRYRIEALGEAKILPVLFKHAQALTKTLGGDPASPTFRAWTKPAPKRRGDTAAKPAAAKKSRATARAA